MKGLRRTTFLALALTLVCSGRAQPQGPPDIGGLVDEVRPGQSEITFMGRTFTLGEETVVIHEWDHEPIPLSQVIPGERVSIWGDTDSLGVYHPRMVLLASNLVFGGPLDEWGVGGFSILGLPFQTMDGIHAFLGRLLQRPQAREGFAPGDVVATSFLLSGQERVAGVLVELLPNVGVDAPVVRVDSSGSTATVGRVQVRAVPWASIQDEDGQPLTWGDVGPGRWFEVLSGEQFAQDSLIVESARLHQDSGEPWEWVGPVQSVDSVDSLLEILGSPIRVTRETRLFDTHLEPLGLGDVRVGDFLGLAVEPDADSNLVALQGMSWFRWDQLALTRGPVEAIDWVAHEMRVGEGTVLFGGQTHITFRETYPLRVEDLDLGVTAWVNGQIAGEKIAAFSISIDPSYSVANHPIESIDPAESLLVTFGQRVAVKSKTIVLRQSPGAPPERIPFGELAVGDTVAVDGQFQAPDTLIAYLITVPGRPTGVGEAPPAPPRTVAAPRLDPNYPNPFNPVTAIGFVIPEAEAPASGRDAAGKVALQLRVYDLRGRSVRLLLDSSLVPGRYEVAWDGTDERGLPMPSGVYLCRLEWAGGRVARKMILLR